MVDYVDITETYMVAGDFDSRKRYARKKSGGALAVCSGVTWTTGWGTSNPGNGPFQPFKWSMGARGSATFSLGVWIAPDPSPLAITDITI